MKRFIKNLESTTPFVNSDFHDILQYQHMRSYSAMLEGISDFATASIYATTSINSGIILRGCKIVNVTINPDDTFDYVMDFNNSLVYIDGNYYTPQSNLIGPNFQINGVNQFYLKPVTQSSVQTRTFRTGIDKPFSTKYEFEVVAKNFPGTASTGTASGIKYVGFEWGGTSRKLSRLIKWASTGLEEILISTKEVILRDGPGTFAVWRDWDLTTGMGRNEKKGYYMDPALAGRFLLGYDSTAGISPPNLPVDQNYTTTRNYARLYASGGTHAFTFSLSQVVKHDHGGTLSKAAESELDHNHVYEKVHYPGLNLPSGLPVPFYQHYDYLENKQATDTNADQYNIDYKDYNYLMYGRKLVNTQNKSYHFFDGLNDFYTNYPARWFRLPHNELSAVGVPPSAEQSWNLVKTHTHSLSTEGGNIPHENRPKYMVVLYYYKTQM